MAVFQCQYPNCRRVITGNVSFVCHLWAHIATWKEFDPKSSSYPAVGESATINTSHSRRNDVDMLSTCPSCTARFHTPYLMQVCDFFKPLTSFIQTRTQNRVKMGCSRSTTHDATLDSRKRSIALPARSVKGMFVLM